FNKTSYELNNDRKPDISFLHVFKALCYPKNDREDIRKLGEKGSANPEKQLKEVKRIFRYLWRTVNMGLWYTKDYGFELTGFSYVDHTGCQDTFKSTSGGTQFVSENLEDVYVCQPKGFIDVDHPIHVYKLKKALDGLNHAPRACGTGSANPEKQLKEVKRIFRYLWRTVNMGLWYTKDYGFELTGFSYVDHTGCQDTFKSTSGGTQFVSENLVSWSSKKQDCKVLSTAEAKYVSLSACCAQVLWMKTQLMDYGFHSHKISIYCDLSQP
nr:uncharacterized mitochondrial protein AtMg00810-like [Tanacetum cinerariifolium]